ncbi:MAG: hypothetical protein QHJ82_08275 [Verrucomicrobiota bacterium]|nr:hypothetical protein [Verrucomicrobiota bacterium]
MAIIKLRYQLYPSVRVKIDQNLPRPSSFRSSSRRVSTPALFDSPSVLCDFTPK